MKSVLVGLCGLVAPGFAHGLMRQRKMMWIIFASAYLAAIVITWTVWASLVVAAIVIASVVHAGLLHRRLARTIRWSWLDPVLVFAGVIVANITLRVYVVEAFKSPSTSMNPTLELGDHFFINKLSGAPTRGDIIVFRQPCTQRDFVKRVIGLAGDRIEVRCSVIYLNDKPVARELVDANCTYVDTHDERGDLVERSCSRYRETLDGASYEVFHDATQPARDRDHVGGFGDFPENALEHDCRSQGFGRDEPTAQKPARLVVASTLPADTCLPHMHVVVPEDSVFVLGDNRANSADSRTWGTVPVSHVKGRVTGRWLPLGRFGAI